MQLGVDLYCRGKIQIFTITAHLVGAVEYTKCISAEG